MAHMPGIAEPVGPEEFFEVDEVGEVGARGHEHQVGFSFCP
jgi:hypothetical protein